MKNRCVGKFLSSGLSSLLLVATSYHEDGGRAPVDISAAPSAGGESVVRRRTPVLSSLAISPRNFMGIESGAQFQLIVKRYHSDYSMKHLTRAATWSHEIYHVPIVHNKLGSVGISTSVSEDCIARRHLSETYQYQHAKKSNDTVSHK